MLWIKCYSGIEDNPKVRRLAEELGLDIDCTCGKLLRFWRKVAEQCEDGDISSWSQQDIAFFFNYSGDEKILFRALSNGWIDIRDDQKLIHNYWEHNQAYLKIKYRSRNPDKLKEIERIYSDQSRDMLRDTLRDTQRTMSRDVQRLDR